MLGFFKKDKAADLAIPEHLQGEGDLYAIVTTSMGRFVILLHEKKAPRTVANFVGLATGFKAWTDPRTGRGSSDPLYDGTLLHRVIPNFMIQGGDPLGQGTGGPGYQFRDEFHPDLRHDKPCVVSMANSGPNTNGSQFFVTEVPTPWLDNRHSVFGLVVDGAELISKIANVPRDTRDRPRTEVQLTSVEIVRATSQPRA